jgi:Type IV secretory system Conjugative DNA transfer
MKYNNVADFVKRSQHNATILHGYQDGDFYLGYGKQLNGNHFEIGVTANRHAITIAGSRTGKGAAVIIPNLLRWSESALVIDPKGEAAIATAKQRAAMGQAVHILDPFNAIQNEDLQQFKAAFNPLEFLDPNAPTIREDILVITDGIMLKDNEKSGFWDDGGQDLINGFIAQLVTSAPIERRNLPELRRMITFPKNDFDALTQFMELNNSCAGLPQAAAAKIKRGGKEFDSFMSVVERNTSWLDSPPIKTVLSSSTFNLFDLKSKPCTVFLVIPANYLNTQGRFLRLFVRSALDAMAKGAVNSPRKCLFILDEFFALGKIDEIVKSAGLMPSYGIRLWPFLQDINQIKILYGQNGDSPFLANSDLWQFFGNRDPATIQFTSDNIGTPTTPIQMGGNGQIVGAMFGVGHQNRNIHNAGNLITGAYGLFSNVANGLIQEEYSQEMNEYQRQAQTVGRPRIPAEEVAQLVKRSDDVVANGQIVFLDGNEPFFLKLAPYFRALPDNPTPKLGRLQGTLAKVMGAPSDVEGANKFFEEFDEQSLAELNERIKIYFEPYKRLIPPKKWLPLLTAILIFAMVPKEGTQAINQFLAFVLCVGWLTFIYGWRLLCPRYTKK